MADHMSAEERERLNEAKYQAQWLHGFITPGHFSSRIEEVDTSSLDDAGDAIDGLVAVAEALATERERLRDESKRLSDVASNYAYEARKERVKCNEARAALREAEEALLGIASESCNLMPDWYCQSHSCDRVGTVTAPCFMADARAYLAARSERSEP